MTNSCAQVYYVTSSSISSIGYDEQTSIMEVEFTSGDVYRYFDVSEYVHQQFPVHYIDFPDSLYYYCNTVFKYYLYEIYSERFTAAAKKEGNRKTRQKNGVFCQRIYFA